MLGFKHSNGFELTVNPPHRVSFSTVSKVYGLNESLEDDHYKFSVNLICKILLTKSWSESAIEG